VADTMTPESPTTPLPDNPRGYTKEIWFIHGANASSTSFNYIREQLQQDPEFNTFKLVDISYNCQENLAKIVQILAASAPRETPLYLVGHSLGGVLAVAISQRIKHFDLPVNIRGVFTLSSPFGGSESADYLRWMYPTYHLFSNIWTGNKLLTDLQSAGTAVPTMSLITSGGNNPLFSAANDGVVTVHSQRCLTGPSYVEVPYNHFEVMVAPDAVDHLKSFLKNK
jgi:pimeloyl-ACP methyl ester carboxylesterase